MGYSFVVFADGCANLPKDMLEGIKLIPNDYLLDDEPQVYLGDVDHFDGKTFYDQLRSGKVAKTSLLNSHLFETHFRPELEQGQDIIYISMSSGISGTYNAAKIAADELMEEFPDRFIHIVDSHGCGFGNGLLAVKAATLSANGTDVKEAAAILDDAVPHACQYFTVDDLNFLKRTGRVSGVAASLGTVLNIKPILYGDSTGHIVTCGKVRGRSQAINALAKKFKEKVMDVPDQHICISHGDCLEDAETLKGLVQEIAPGVPITIAMHEPFSGAHVGPGMLGLFFYGKER
ncbi:MAG: DegV family protein [Butyrivibrio sp.]|nr:DegV family protein [Butyrivibrio sp.]